jgi:hypothetical protein
MIEFGILGLQKEFLGDFNFFISAIICRNFNSEFMDFLKKNSKQVVQPIGKRRKM